MAGSPYITQAGYERLNNELHALWVKRRRVTDKLAAAAAEGDRSENADYIYRKKQLREMDRRVRYLARRLDGITVADRLPEERDKVFFGAWVTVADEAGSEVEYRIVGPDEFDADQRWISMDAPMGQALLGRRLDDAVTVRLPEGTRELDIVAIRYE